MSTVLPAPRQEGAGADASPVPAASRVALRLLGISKRYPGVQALRDVSFECAEGEIHAVVGENGSGKSTLLGMASGVNAPDTGSVEILGQQLPWAHPAVARAMGVAEVYQGNSVVLDLTVAENLYLSAPPRRRASRYGQMLEWAAERIDEYGVVIDPRLRGDQLSLAQRQQLEVIKALLADPRVLLLDEPTTALGPAEVTHLHAGIRGLARRGIAVVYVSHRLPEVLDIADRITVLRDGTHQGTYDVDTLSEEHLVTVMAGTRPELEFPPRADAAADEDGREPVLVVDRLVGAGFGPVDLRVAPGEIVGLAGAEGNGQLELLRALGGLDHAAGRVTCGGRTVRPSSPRSALRSGILMLSGDRPGESTFPQLGVRHNATVQVLSRISSAGVLRHRQERGLVLGLVQRLGVKTPSLDQPVRMLSGGNQQKVAMGRTFLRRGKVLLIDEPTQGVDVKSRADIYRALRAEAAAGVATLIKSSDAHELVGLCDRVLVFSRGRVIAEGLKGAQLTEESVIGAFVGSGAQRSRGEEVKAALAATRSRPAALVSGLTSAGLPLLLLTTLMLAMGGYTASRSSTFLAFSNIQSLVLSTMPLALVAMAQLSALLVGGFDISVGSVMSLTVVTASFLAVDGKSAPLVIIGLVLCLGVGLAVGVFNGTLIRGLRLSPVVATIATLSILQGIALVLRATPGGSIDTGFQDRLGSTVGFLPVAFIGIVALAVAADVWLYRSRRGLATRATGHEEEAARRAGVSTTWLHLRAYMLSGLLAALAGLFLAAQVGVGDATVGSEFTLTSIAAAVLGGASLFGGRGSFVGAVLGALFLSLIVNIIPLLGLTTAIGQIATGSLTLLAIVLYSGRELWSRMATTLRAALPAAPVAQPEAAK